ncbi:HNH endonuclease [Kosakonia sp. 1610]
MREKGLTPHHLSTNTIILVPGDLHGNVPHIGSASDMRRTGRC